MSWFRDMFPGMQTTASLTEATKKIAKDIATAIVDDPYFEWAEKSEAAWRERAEAMQTKDNCLWCTTPYEDESGSCTKCGAPKDVREIEAVAIMMCST